MKKDKIYTHYLDLNTFTGAQFKAFWDFVFQYADRFSLRFPNSHHATSNTMKIQYNDRGEKDEIFCKYLQKNAALIAACDCHLIKKYDSNIYLDEKYANLSTVYVCKMFDGLKAFIQKQPNLFLWQEPDLPKDLSFYINGQRLVYTCSHEEICILYLTAEQEGELTAILN